MKKILSLIMIMLILFSVCSCNSKPDTEDAGQIIIDSEDTATQTDKTEQTPKPEPEPEQTDGDKEKTDTLTLDNNFCKYTVIVTLTDEESSKKLSYTKEDFPDVDIIGIFEDHDGSKDGSYYADSYQDEKYYPDEYYPEYINKTTLYFMLKHPSEQNVSDAVKILEKDSRVYSACPNAEIITEHAMYIYSDKELDENEFSKLGTINKSKKYIAQLFGRENCFYFSLNDESGLSLEQTAERLLENDIVKNVEYVYQCHWGEKVRFNFKYELWNKERDTEYTIKDFPFLTDEDRITVHDMYIEISLKEYSKQRVRDIAEYMKANSGDVTFTGSFGWIS